MSLATPTTTEAVDGFLAEFGGNQVVTLDDGQRAHDAVVASLEVSGCVAGMAYLSQLNELLAQARTDGFSTIPAADVVNLLLDIRISC